MNTTGLRQTTEQTMIAAHQAGVAYWKRNKSEGATDDSLALLARSCGWHGEDNTAWLAGYKGAQRRETTRPCAHNTMVPNDSETHAWKCADCGYVYG